MGKRIRRALLRACVILTLLAGCGKSVEQGEPKLLLGFSQIGAESAWRIGNTRDIEEQAENYDVSLMLENANQKQENQIAAIRRFIAYKVDVIAFSPIVEDGWDNVLMEAKDAGIPVILVDRDVNTEKEGLTACLIGADFYKEGVMAAEYLIRKADSLGLEQVKIVEITGEAPKFFRPPFIAVSREMYELIDSLNKKDGITVIMVSHDMNAAVRYASHILHIGGKQLFFGTKEDYMNSKIGQAFLSVMGGEDDE